MSDKKPIRVGVSGAAGRMGREITSEVESNSDFVLTAALESETNPNIGKLAGKSREVRIAAEFDPAKVDVFIDFSTPLAALKLLSECRRHEIPMVIGVTGFSENEKSLIAEAAKDIPIVAAPNMSLGINLISLFINKIATTLHSYDVEISEAHHRHKKDAPSGTALRLGEIIAEARGQKLADVAVYGRHGKDSARKKDEIGFSVMRGGDIVGEHRVVFADGYEQLEIIHRATDRGHFAVGALLACIFTIQAAPGLYDMRDVINKHYKIF